MGFWNRIGTYGENSANLNKLGTFTSNSASWLTHCTNTNKLCRIRRGVPTYKNPLNCLYKVFYKSNTVLKTKIV